MQSGASLLHVAQNSGAIPLGATKQHGARASVKNVQKTIYLLKRRKGLPSESYEKFPQRAAKRLGFLIYEVVQAMVI